MTGTQRSPERFLMLGFVFLLSSISIAVFNPALWGETRGGAENIQSAGGAVQQYVIIALWIIIILLSTMRGMRRQPMSLEGLFWPIAFLLYAASSAAWSDAPGPSWQKSAVLLLTAVGIWRVALTLSIQEFFDCVFYSLLSLVVASLGAVMLIPDVAVSSSYFHAGDWAGVFSEKQELGIVSGYLLFLALCRTFRHFTLFNFIACAIALTALVGSTSRGGIVLATVAAAPLLLPARRYAAIVPAFVGVLWIDFLLAMGGIMYLWITGSDMIVAFDREIDFTNRTLIWQYSVQLWVERPFFGYGINGFWTKPEVYFQFLWIHKWVLDNFHDGYLAITTELGIVGIFLFATNLGFLGLRICKMARDRSLPSPTLETVVGILLISFTINLTETSFLRSTNFGQIMVSFIVVKLLGDGYWKMQFKPTGGKAYASLV